MGDMYGYGPCRPLRTGMYRGAGVAPVRGALYPYVPHLATLYRHVPFTPLCPAGGPMIFTVLILTAQGPRGP